MAKTCIFCGGSGPFSNEHVMPEWTAKVVGMTGERVEVSGRRLDGPLRTWQSVGSFGTTVRGVCIECNNTWMSKLENLAKPILSPMMVPQRPVQLDPDQQTVVAAWLWKLGIVHEHASGVKYFNTAERQCLPNWDDPPIGGVHMWIAAYSGPLIGNLRGGPATFSAPDGRTVEGFLMSMSLRRFAAQVLCVRQMPGTNVDVVNRYNFKGAESLIWPEPEKGVIWPAPAASLDAHLFDRWHLRWNSEG